MYYGAKGKDSEILGEDRQACANKPWRYARSIGDYNNKKSCEIEQRKRKGIKFLRGLERGSLAKGMKITTIVVQHCPRR